MAMKISPIPIQAFVPDAPEKTRSAAVSASSSDLIRNHPAAYSATPRPPAKMRTTNAIRSKRTGRS
jgi:hypothetical protein